MGKNKHSKQKQQKRQKQQKQTPQLEPAGRLYVHFDAAADVRLLAGDLCSRWKRYSTTFESEWRSYSQEDRAHLLAEAMSDQSCYQFLPDWDTENMATDPSVVLNMLEHRATTKLSEQAVESSVNGPSDLDITQGNPDMLHVFFQGYVDVTAYTAFCDGDKYGLAYQAPSWERAAAVLFPSEKDRHLCVHQVVGDNVLVRQSHILEILGSLVRCVWNVDPEEQPGPRIPVDPLEPAWRVLETLQREEPVAKASYDSVLDTARRSKASLTLQLAYLGMETGLLKDMVVSWLRSYPERVLDKESERAPILGDKHIGICLYDAVHDLARQHAFWAYLAEVLSEWEGLGGEDGTGGRAIVLREMANVCHMGFQRAQGVLKRFIQVWMKGEKEGSFLFVKTLDEYDGDGYPLVTLAVEMDELHKLSPAMDPTAQYIVRLCQPETTAEAAFEWLQKLKDRCKATGTGAALEGAEAKSLEDLIDMLHFIRDVTDAVSLPPVNEEKRVKGLFVSKCRRVYNDLWALRDKLELTEFTVPLVRLGKPAMAGGALTAINDLCRRETGANIEENYEKALRESLDELRRRCAEAQSRYRKEKGLAPADPSVFVEKVKSKQHDDEQQPGKKAKVKTRPTEGAEGAPPPPPPPPPPTPTPAPEPEKIKVSATTAAVFDVLFNRTRARRPLAFPALEAAMAELGFTVNSQGGVGSATSFIPPAGSGWESITVHRPHGPVNKIEGYRLMRLGSRFNGHFGWAAETFEVA
ncbi:hypothetical protein LZ32DRAFT_576446 [Colletotrichum eremochloae]|nr:hypothetical protein LZ32DRAFT_576446 [Colletotrichum eremochloae]